jgi:hypothetical protein
MDGYALPMTDALSAALTEQGYRLPESWPFPARVAPEFNSKHGWKVETIGEGRQEGTTVYTAPDGAKFTKASNGSRVALVGLSKRCGAFGLRVLPGTRRPQWLIADTPKGEIPEALRAYLLKPGEKLEKGKGRKAAEAAAKLAAEAAAFTIEPEEVHVAKRSGGNGRAALDYSAMTEAQIVEWAKPRIGYWQARAYQIEQQGHGGFRAKVREALAAAGLLTPRVKKDEKPTAKKAVKAPTKKAAAKRYTRPAPKPSAKRSRKVAA